jgi:hypothetical protein
MIASAAAAQGPGNRASGTWRDGTPAEPRSTENERRIMEREKEELEKFRKRAEMVSRSNDSNLKKYSNGELTSAQKKLLSPAPGDEARFAQFLKQSNAGIFRLLPKGKYEPSLTVNANDPDSALSLPISGAGAAYSFTKKKHEFSQWSEIGLQNGNLFSGFSGAALGFMTNLGDAPLESIQLDSAGAAYLASIQPPKDRSEAIEQSKRNAQGVTAGGFTYKSVLPAAPGSTYALRSIAEGRADILVAFRIARQDDDGSLIILWKQLKRASAPKLK